MKPVAFDYQRPDTLAQALDCLAELGDDVKVLAGGQSLIPMLNLRLARPAVLVDISRLDLTGFTSSVEGVTIGALNRHRRFEQDPDIAEALPLLPMCASHIGYPAIRNRGTFGGSLAHADGTAEWSLASLAMDADITAQSRDRGSRTVGIEDFLLGPFTTALEEDELLTHVHIPAAARQRSYAFGEFAERSGDFAIGSAIVGFAGHPEERTDARVVSAGLAAIPLRLRHLEELLNNPATPTSADVGDALASDVRAHKVDVRARGHIISVVQALVDQCLNDLSVATGGTQ